MRRKGIEFRYDNKLLFRNEAGEVYNFGSNKGQRVLEHHVTIYRANKKRTPDCREWVDSHGNVWYLHQVKMTGHSRTNMVYGELFKAADGGWHRRIYWVEDGRVYIGRGVNQTEIGVHVAHCCKTHGCRYGDKRCPVVIGEVKQSGKCEDCAFKPEPQKIPVNEQDNVLGVLWFLLQDAESKCGEDPVMKLHVSQTYDLLNRIGYTKMRPRWEEVVKA